LRQIITAPPPDEEPPETVLRASLGLWLHCLSSGNVGEGAHWMRMITSRYPRPPRPETSLTWCRAVWVAGFLLFIHGDHNSTTENIERGEKVLAQLSATPSHG
ncbi:hypothetical protein, partial [Streptomyces sp. NRRL F-3273]|uniref:hypothetical protein n=1 Tax=Streptomyces sp. NRRL F-3273 TaxID=1463848 RepID=UPI001F3803B7